MNKRLKLLSVVLFFFSSLVVAQNLTKEEWGEALGEARAFQSAQNFEYFKSLLEERPDIDLSLYNIDPLNLPQTQEEFQILEATWLQVVGLKAFASSCVIDGLFINFYFDGQDITGLLFYNEEITPFKAKLINESFLIPVGEDEVEIWFTGTELCKGIRINDDFGLATAFVGRTNSYFEHGMCQAILGRIPSENLELVYLGSKSGEEEAFKEIVTVNAKDPSPSYTVQTYLVGEELPSEERTEPFLLYSKYWLYESSSCGMPAWYAYVIDHALTTQNKEGQFNFAEEVSDTYGQSVFTTLYNYEYLLQASFGCNASGCSYLNLESVTLQ